MQEAGISACQCLSVRCSYVQLCMTFVPAPLGCLLLGLLFCSSNSSSCMCTGDGSACCRPWDVCPNDIELVLDAQGKPVTLGRGGYGKVCTGSRSTCLRLLPLH